MLECSQTHTIYIIHIIHFLPFSSKGLKNNTDQNNMNSRTTFITRPPSHREEQVTISLMKLQIITILCGPDGVSTTVLLHYWWSRQGISNYLYHELLTPSALAWLHRERYQAILSCSIRDSMTARRPLLGLSKSSPLSRYRSRLQINTYMSLYGNSTHYS